MVDQLEQALITPNGVQGRRWSVSGAKVEKLERETGVEPRSPAWEIDRGSQIQNLASIGSIDQQPFDHGANGPARRD